MRASYHAPPEANSEGEIIAKTKGRIKQAVSDPTGNKRPKREDERDERKAKSQAR